MEKMGNWYLLPTALMSNVFEEKKLSKNSPFLLPLNSFCTVKSYQMMENMSWACHSIPCAAQCYLMFNNTQCREKQIWPLPDLVFICTFATFVSHHCTNTSEGNPLKDTMQLQNDGFIYEGVGGQIPNLPRQQQQQSLRLSELFQLDYIGGFWCMNCPFKVTAVGFQSRLWLDRTFYFVFDKPVWGEPAGVFCCRIQVFFSLRQWSDIQMFSISIFRYTESQCLVPPDRHTTSMYDWWNSAEAQWFWLRFSPMLPFLPNFFTAESWIWPYLRPVCFNII